MRFLYILLCGFFLPIHVAIAEQPSSKTDFVSVFDSYQNWEPESFGDWRLANNIVSQIGGWRFYSREPSFKQNINSEARNRLKILEGDVK
jgi:hypothetical protein